MLQQMRDHVPTTLRSSQPPLGLADVPSDPAGSSGIYQSDMIAGSHLARLALTGEERGYHPSAQLRYFVLENSTLGWVEVDGGGC